MALDFDAPRDMFLGTVKEIWVALDRRILIDDMAFEFDASKDMFLGTVKEIWDGSRQTYSEIHYVAHVYEIKKKKVQQPSKRIRMLQRLNIS